MDHRASEETSAASGHPGTEDVAMGREIAVESLAHQVASCVHLMLANRHMTVAALKEKLQALDWSDGPVIDAILTATNPHFVTMLHLADVAFALGFDWDFKITKPG